MVESRRIGGRVDRVFHHISGGRVMRSEPRVRMTEPDDDGWTPAQACQTAAALLNAADLID
jgi:hypothetical protein